MFTDQQNNIITGLILGDGHLSKKGRAKNASLIVKRAQHDIEYSKYHVAIFDSHVTESKLKEKNVFDSRTNKNYYSCEYTLKACEELTHFHDKWYFKKKKIVPEDLQLNGEIIATWFCDDGTIKKSANGYLEISLATNSFSLNEVNFLARLLSERYQSRIGINKSSSEKDQQVLHLSDYAARKMVMDMDPFFPQGMERKRKWSNGFAEKCYYSTVESSEEKRNKVEQFIKENDSFLLTDLAKYLDWKFTRSNGSIELDTQNCKRYLKKYIQDGIIKENPRSESYKKGLSYSKII